jgi:serine/threonine protein kinase
MSSSNSIPEEIYVKAVEHLEILQSEGDSAADLFLAAHEQDRAAIVEAAERIRAYRGVGSVESVDYVYRYQTGALIGKEIEINGTRSPRYEIIESLGRGGSGEVYSAYDRMSRDTYGDWRKVAIKFVTNISRIRIRREIDSLKALDHPNIVKIEEADVDQGFYTMTYISDVETLKERVERAGSTGEDLLTMVAKISRAVSYANQKGIIHRDIKPGNILVTRDGEPLLIDFGLALFENRNSSSRRSWVGTPRYVAPEMIISGEKPYSKWSDCYSLGACLYFVLTGSDPVYQIPNSTMSRSRSRTQTPIYDARSYLAVVEDSRSSVSQPTKLIPSLDPCLNFIVAKAMNRVVEKRYESGDQFAIEIENFLSGGELIAEKPTIHEIATQWWRHNHKLVKIASLLTTIVLGFVGYYFWNEYQMRIGAEKHGEQLEEINGQLEEANIELQSVNEDLELSLNQNVKALKEKNTAHHVRILQEVAQLKLDGRFDDLRHSISEMPEERIGFESHLFRRSTPALQQTVIGQHDYAISSSLFDSTTKTAVTAGYDGRLCVWDTQTFEANVLVEGQWSKKERRYEFAFSTNSTGVLYHDLAWVDVGKTFLGGTRSGGLILWDVGQAKSETIVQFDSPITSICFNPDKKQALVGLENETLIFVDIDKGEAVSDPINCRGVVTDSLVFSDFGWCYATSLGTVELRSFESFEVIDKLNFEYPVWKIAFSKKHSHIFVGADVPNVTSWRFDRDAKKFSMSLAYRMRDTISVSTSRAIHSLIVDDENDCIIAATDEPSIVGWDLDQPGNTEYHFTDRQGSLLRPVLDKLPIHCARTYSDVFLSGTKGSFLTAGINGTLRQLTVVTPEEASVHQTTEGAIICFDGSSPNHIWECNGNHSLRVIDIRNGVKSNLEEFEQTLVDLKSLPGGGVLVAFENGEIKIRDRLQQSSDELVFTHESKISKIEISQTGTLLAVVDEETVVTFYSLAERTKLSQTKPLGGDVRDWKTCFDVLEQSLALRKRNQTLILSVASAELKEDADLLFNASGAGAIAAADQATGRFYGGSNNGGLNVYPERRVPWYSSSGKPIVGIAITRTQFCEPYCASRMFVGHRNGILKIVDPENQLTLLELKSPIANDIVYATGLLANCDGSRIMMLHSNGQIVVWTAWEKSGTTASGELRTTKEVVFKGIESSDYLMNVRSVATHCDKTYVFAAMLDNKHNEVQAKLLLCELDGTNTRTWIIGEVEIDAFGMLRDSLSLFSDGNKLQISFYDPNRRQLFLASVRSPIVESNLDITFEKIRENTPYCYQNQIVMDGNQRPAFLHFSPQGYYLVLLKSEDGNYVHQFLGRQGDGNRFQVCQTLQELRIFHSTQRSLNGASLKWFYRVDRDSGFVKKRTIVGRNIDEYFVGLSSNEELSQYYCYTLLECSGAGAQIKCAQVDKEGELEKCVSVFQFEDWARPLQVRELSKLGYPEIKFSYIDGREIHVISEYEGVARSHRVGSVSDSLSYVVARIDDKHFGVLSAENGSIYLHRIANSELIVD